MVAPEWLQAALAAEARAQAVDADQVVALARYAVELDRCAREHAAVPAPADCDVCWLRHVQAGLAAKEVR